MARVEISETVMRVAGVALVPVASASVQVNIRGGSAATVYTAATGGTTVSNPLTTDSAGRVEGWVEPGSYDLVVSKTGITTYTQRFEAASGTASDAELIAQAGVVDTLISGAITRDGNGAATAGTVAWPDGATGVYAGTASSAQPGAVDSYTVTHVLNGVTKTLTQPAVTRDSSTGAVTTRPAITVT